MYRKLMTLISCGLVSGCAMTPPELSVLDKPDLSAPRVESTTLLPEVPGIAPGKALTVADAVRIALVNNADIGQAISLVREAEAKVRRAIAAFSPSLDASFSWQKWYASYTPGIARRDEMQWPSLDAGWSLFAGGRDWQRYHAARDKEKAQGFQLERTRQLVESLVRQAFYQAVLAREGRAIAEASVAFSSRELEVAKASYEVGKGLRTDMLTFQTRALEAQVQVIEAQNAYRSARHALGELMAVSLDEEIELGMPSETPTEWEQMHSEAVVQAAWDRRPDLAALRRSYSAARRNAKRAAAEFSPRVTVAGSYNAQRMNSGHFRDEDDELAAGVSVDLNLFRGGDTIAAIAAARHAAAQTAEKHRALKLRIRTEVRDALGNIGDARKKLELAQQAEAAADEALRLLLERYHAGSISISEVTYAELRRNGARLKAIEGKIDLLDAQRELSLALGEPGTSE